MNEKRNPVLSKSRRVPLVVRFIQKPFSYQLLVAEALFWISIMWAVIRFLPFRVFLRVIKKHSVDNASVSGDRIDTDLISKKVARTVVSVSRRVPWDCKCLVKASAGKIMLNKRCISNVMCLGVSKSGMMGTSGNRSQETEAVHFEQVEVNNPKPVKREMRPHAWLIAGDEVILGGEKLDDYVEVSRF